MPEYRSAVIGSCIVSSRSIGERIVSRIYYGGRKAAYTAAIGAMIANNLNLPAYAANYTVASGIT